MTLAQYCQHAIIKAMHTPSFDTCKVYSFMTNSWKPNPSEEEKTTKRGSYIIVAQEVVSTNKPVAFRSVHTGIEPPFLLKILCDHCLHDSGLYIQKILTKREMINCQKFNFLLFLTINSVTTAVRELNETSQISLVTHDAKGEMREI